MQWLRLAEWWHFCGENIDIAMIEVFPQNSEVTEKIDTLI